MSIKRIHVNQNTIRKNCRDDTNHPPLSCKGSNFNLYGHEVAIYDDVGKEVARVVYRPDKPLSCGAKCWVETKNPVSVEHQNFDGSVTVVQDLT